MYASSPLDIVYAMHDVIRETRPDTSPQEPVQKGSQKVVELYNYTAEVAKEVRRCTGLNRSVQMERGNNT